MADAIKSPAEVVQDYARACALELHEMLREVDGLDNVAIHATSHDDIESVGWSGYRRGHCVFRVTLIGSEVPHESH